ncbi:radical SAM protein [Ascidiaceihabitans sp.]|uniref:radical SAM protein n=1 Tax=Ascidiaceihabitans sp. TaxID=1872644 RepID=UPI00329943C5
MRVYLIAPKPDFNSGDTENNSILNTIGFKSPQVMVAAASITSIAAWFPPETDLVLCDELIDPVDLDDPADLVGISINVAQVERGLELAAAFRAKGRTVVLGGPHVSLAPEVFEGRADCLIKGEFEPVANSFIDDLFGAGLKPSYSGGKADLSTQPVPRWDLYPNHRALSGVVQTSRGCPFSCNFCDVIQYLGRVQRHKPDDKVIAEIQLLYDHGYREIQLSDDNFTVYRSRSKQLLKAIAKWNSQPERETVGFYTQLSVDVARDPEVLELCNAAGLRRAFIGLETDNEEALKDSGKRQNLKVNLIDETTKILQGGVALRSGLIVGFDHDTTECFERQFNFAQALPIVGYNVTVLVAPVSTPLYDDMKAAGRLVEAADDVLSVGGTSLTNIIPRNMTRAELAEGRDWLKSAILDPENAVQRFEHFARVLAAPVLPPLKTRTRSADDPFLELVSLLARDKPARRLIDFVRDIESERPEISGDLMASLATYLNEYAADRGVSAFKTKNPRHRTYAAR